MSTPPDEKTTTNRIINPRLEIGNESFSEHQIESAQIHTHEDDHSRFRSASVTLNPPFEGRWDYHEIVRVYEGDDLLLTGTCSEAKLAEEGRLHLKLWGLLWHLERTNLQGLGTFGMSGRERFYCGRKVD